MEYDKKNGNPFVDVGNIRITYIDKKTRQPSSNWSDSDTIRFAAYKNDKDSSLHKGAEIPVRTKDEIIDLIEIY